MNLLPNVAALQPKATNVVVDLDALERLLFRTQCIHLDCNCPFQALLKAACSLVLVHRLIAQLLDLLQRIQLSLCGPLREQALDDFFAVAQQHLETTAEVLPAEFVGGEAFLIQDVQDVLPVEDDVDACHFWSVGDSRAALVGDGVGVHDSEGLTAGGFVSRSDSMTRVVPVLLYAL